MPYTFEWNGDRLTHRVRRAAGRGAIDIAVNAALAAKELAAVGDPAPPERDSHPGTLRRSITVGSRADMHEGDFDRAKTGEDLIVDVDSLKSLSVATNGEVGTSIKVEVGSWVPYACVAEVRRPYLYPGVMMARTTSLDEMVKSFREEFG